MNEGAYSFIEKPLDLEHFRLQVNRAAERSALLKQNQILQEQIGDHAGFEGIIGTQPPACRRSCRPPGRSRPATFPC